VGPAAFRSLFPILREKVYLNSCSQGALAEPVEASLRAFIASWHEQGNPWELWCERMEELRGEFAALIGADTDEVAVTFSASTALNAVASALDPHRRSRVVTSDFDFPTVGHVWLAQAQRGLETEFAKAEGDHLPLSAFEAVIDRTTALVSTTHVCYRNGWKNDVRRLAEMAHAHGAPLLIDAFQSMGTEPFNVRELGVDMLVTGSLKYLLGSPGVAFLYARRDLAEELLPADSGWFAQRNPFAYDVHHLDYACGARRFQSGSPPVPAVYTALAALRLLRQVGLEAIRAHVKGLAAAVVEQALQRGWELMTPVEPDRRGPLVMLRCRDIQALLSALAERGILCSTRDGALRTSFHYYNSADDVSALIEALDDNGGLMKSGSPDRDKPAIHWRQG
jgi:selenocysteine lyase/cysteine desulfurase